VAKLKELFDIGFQNREIAKVIGGVTTRQVSRKLFDLGLTRGRITESWSDDRVGLLKKFWGEGLSASQCAKELGGLTRNAVIGKVRRLGLPDRATKQRASFTRGPRVKPEPRPKIVRTKRITSEIWADLPTEAVNELPRPAKVFQLADLEDGQCRYPFGDPQHSDFGFCGCKKVDGLPYCKEHARVAFQPPQPRRRKSVEHPSCSRSAQSFGGKYRNKEVAL
jgi:GcrA cell cycle regulator